MPDDPGPAQPEAGQIVLANWRGDTLPKEANKLRPAVVVEDDRRFAASYPNAMLVPLSDDATLVMPSLSVLIAPSAENGCTKPCWAAAHLVTATSKLRLRPAASRVSADQFAQIRHDIAYAVGVEA